MKLQTQTVADVSTIHVTASDGKKLLDPASARTVAQTFGKEGTYLHLVGEWSEIEDDLATGGYSAALLRIVRMAHEQGCTHIRFDADGQVYPDLPEFSW